MFPHDAPPGRSKHISYEKNVHVQRLSQPLRDRRPRLRARPPARPFTEMCAHVFFC